MLRSAPPGCDVGTHGDRLAPALGLAPSDSGSSSRRWPSSRARDRGNPPIVPAADTDTGPPTPTDDQPQCAASDLIGRAARYQQSASCHRDVRQRARNCAARAPMEDLPCIRHGEGAQAVRGRRNTHRWTHSRSRGPNLPAFVGTESNPSLRAPRSGGRRPRGHAETRTPELAPRGGGTGEGERAKREGGVASCGRWPS